MTASVVVLVSGSGRSLRNLLSLERTGQLSTQTRLVIASRADIGAISHAREFSIPVAVLKPDEITAALDALDPDWVVMAGYLKRWPIPDRYVGRTINIHPSLLPLFGGEGYYGSRVHKAVKESGMRVSGCTVHFVTSEYDAGPIIDQRAVHLFPDDSVEQIAERVFAQELSLLPEVIESLATGQISYDRASGRVVY
ncbi:MAG TPA: phosphoribosylglycinamide formyltransferase [Planctomycetota bacterium]|nr:phosphoribosylglycinamide formyltransferase [Planctomycetota bacterium]